MVNPSQQVTVLGIYSILLFRYSCCIDLDHHTIAYSKNGKDLGIAYSNVNTQNELYPTIYLRDATVVCNFGATSFKACPEGYAPIPYQSIEKRFLYKKRSLLALILEPTRELAQQTY